MDDDMQFCAPLRKDSPMKKRLVLLWLFSISAAAQAASQLTVADPFTDHMVLQQGRKIPVWGTAADGERIFVELNGKKAATTVKDGKWMIRLPAMKAGGPWDMTVRSEDSTVVLRDVLLGEVWLASGQSNMEWTVVNTMNAEAEIASADYPNIRFFTAEKAFSTSPLPSVKGRWEVCSPETAGRFSAVAYFFARKLHLDDGLNVGIIHTSWGGTPAEAWTDLRTLESEPELASLAASFEAFRKDAGRSQAESAKKMDDWNAWWDDRFMDDTAVKAGWAAPEADLTEWTATEIPGSGSILGTFDGTVWYRRDADIPVEWAGRDLVLKLGPIDDFDITYFNGVEIGRIFRDRPNWYMIPRQYTVPGALVKAGPNTIAVRVTDSWLGGGFGDDPGLLKLAVAEGDGSSAVPLAGTWMSRTEFRLDPASGPVRPQAGNESQVSTLLYNAMIHPFVPYGIRGAIWYQGESNDTRYVEYRALFPAMIRGWRKAWGQGDFPFYYVQLANYKQRLDAPAESDWAGLREAQTMTLRLKNTGMAAAIDIGAASDIHPRNKQDVGKRLALWAEAKVYGKDIVYSGPMFRSVRFEGVKAVVTFDHAEGGLEVKGTKAEGFAVAGPDGKFVWAEAEIQGNRAIVSSPDIPVIKAVRYGWADNPAVNLTNRAGLPAVPFRTDRP
jgi:sialate O-acetylesterase